MRKLSIRQKKGDVFQIIILLILLFVFSIIGFFTTFLSWKFTGSYDALTKDSAQFNSTQYSQTVNKNIHNQIPYAQDTFVFLFFLGMNIGLIAGAAKTGFNPIVMGLFFIVLMFAIFISMGFAEFYHGLASADAVSDYSGLLNFSNIIFSKYTPLIICLMGAMIMLVMYGKSGTGIIA